MIEKKLEDLVQEFEDRVKAWESAPKTMDDLTPLPDTELDEIAGGHLTLRVNTKNSAYRMICPKCRSEDIRFKHISRYDGTSQPDYTGYFDFSNQKDPYFFRLIRQEEETCMVCKNCGFEGYYGEFYMRSVPWDGTNAG